MIIAGIATPRSGWWIRRARPGIFDVPADYKLDVVQTPPPLEASVDGAAYYPAPPFKNTGVGRFYVTPTANDRCGAARATTARRWPTSLRMKDFPATTGTSR